MASATDVLIQQLHQVEDLLAALKKEEALTKEDLKIFSIANKYFGEKYFFKNNYPKFLLNLPISAVRDYIDSLESKNEEKKSKQEKTKEQESSIPPELESMVAEYRQNQDLLNQEEIKSNSQRSVAEQVKIAIAHRNIVEQARANRERRTQNGEVFLNNDEAFVKYGLTKAGSKTAALAETYSTVKQVAFLYEGFSKLPSRNQNEIISSAVELKAIGVVDTDTAIQAATFQVDSSSLSDIEKKYLGTIPGGFVSVIYQKTLDINQKASQYETEVTNNENQIYLLSKQGKSNDAQFLIEENQRLTVLNSNLTAEFIDTANKQSDAFKEFEKRRQYRLSSNPDLVDSIEKANRKISEIHDLFEAKGVKGRLTSPLDDAYLLEQAIRHDLPGELNSFAGYEAEEVASLVKFQNKGQTISPQAILLYGKDLNPKLLAQARLFAQNNPDSTLGKLFKSRKDIFDTSGIQIRKIAGSQLGKEISKPTTGIGKVFKSLSKSFGKVSDQIGSFGKVFRVISNPWGALKSWAGRKAGEQIANRLIQKAGNAAFNKAGEVLLSQGIKGGVRTLVKEALTRAVIKGATWAATKLGISLAAESINAIAPGVGVLVDIALQIILFVAEKTIGFVYNAYKNISKSIYGEEVKARDILIAPVAVVSSVVGGVITFFGTLASATAAAASSAVTIAVTGIFVGFFFYVTSIVVAPLISTLVNLQSTPGLGSATGCANIEGTYVSQRDPAWSNVLCPTCTSVDNCKIGNSGCGSASTTMILKSFGVNEDIVNIWNIMHSAGGYAYSSSHPYTSCPSYATANIQVMTDNGLTVTDIGYSLEEADKSLESCGLIFALGMLYTDCPDQVAGCGHYLVITGHNGNQITTNDPWSGEQFVHNIDGIGGDTFKISRMWAVVP
jgi:hypothetical protein